MQNLKLNSRRNSAKSQAQQQKNSANERKDDWWESSEEDEVPEEIKNNPNLQKKVPEDSKPNVQIQDWDDSMMERSSGTPINGNPGANVRKFCREYAN